MNSPRLAQPGAFLVLGGSRADSPAVSALHR
jgi:hypothetical protein